MSVRLSVCPSVSLSHLFSPQPSRLEGYFHGPGSRAGGYQTCGTHISVTAWWIFSIRSSVELCSCALSWSFAHGSNLPQIGSKLAESISLKLLDGFTPFKVSWICQASQLFAPLPYMGLPMGQKLRHLDKTLRNPYLWNCWMDLYHLKFYGIVLTCSCATSWSFDLDPGFWKFWKCCISGMGGHGMKGMWIGC